MTCTESVTERAAMRIQWLNALLHLIHYIIVLRTKVNVFSYDKTLPFKSTIVAHDGFCSVRFGLCSVLKQREESVSPWQNMSRKKKEKEKWIPAKVSPFFAEDSCSFMKITEPPSLCIAAAKDEEVLVLTSKNSEAITLPWKTKTTNMKKKKYINKEVNNSCSKLFSQSVYENAWL